MDKTITTALLIIISMILGLMLFNSAYPAIMDGSDAITNLAGNAEDRMKSQIKVIHATGELDSDGNWQDTDGNGQFDVFIWVKNVGSTSIRPLEALDVFFGQEASFVRITHQDSTASFPYWFDTLEGATAWDPSETLKITVQYSFPLPSGRYFYRITIPNGVSDDGFVGL